LVFEVDAMLKKLNLFFLTVLFSLSVSAQNGDERFPLKPKVEINPPYCEFNIIELEKLEKTLKSDDLLMVVSHLGKVERASMSQRRLFNVVEQAFGKFSSCY
jgi:hypothetical protein